ncbi:uncharacterized protein LOC115376761 isoform X2 [Myripristis murdjan]|uniref:uncharacterized protein LOC115376761 isoform X2 n=1 Tax=Myripristis murdjan TaxID=586833 RepID=UPI0011763B93|nr:uncharacterized protein LOC115376761 isoform X2 [Myripristis murdjan]
MDTRLVLAVVLVALAWMSAGTNKMAVEAMSANSTNGNMTNGNMTNGNMTNPNMTNPNMTSGNMTGGQNMTNTTSPNPPGPLTTNTTVEILETTVNRSECRKTRLCVATPENCDPATPDSCLFVSFKSAGGQNFAFELSGETEGYIACTISTDSNLGGNDNTYVCANNNGIVKFIPALLNDDKLTETNLSVNSVKGKVNGTKVQCTFDATVPDPTARASARFAIGVSNGTYNSSTGKLGPPEIKIQTNPVNLANPNATVTNQVNGTAANTTTPPAATTASTTAGHAIALQQSLSQALLIIMGVLGLAML